MLTNRYGRRISLAEDLKDIITDALAESDIGEEAVDIYIRSKAFKGLGELLVEKIREHLNPAIDEATN